MPIRKIAFWSCILIFIGLALWLLGWNLYANQKEKLVRETWGKILVPLDDLEKIFPPIPANSTALELERLAAAIGIDLRPARPDRPHPTEEEIKSRQNLYRQLGRYMFLEIQLEKSDDSLDEPPLEFRPGWDGNRHIRSIVDFLVSNEAPRWEFDLRKAALARDPPFKDDKRMNPDAWGTSQEMWHLVNLDFLLRRLAVETLVDIRESRIEWARQDIGAIMKLEQALRLRPELNYRLYHMGFVKVICRLQRKLPNEFKGWSDVEKFDYRTQMAEAFEVEAWRFNERLHSVSSVSVRWLWPLRHPMDQIASIRLSYHYLARARACLQEDACQFDPKQWKARYAPEPGPWKGVTQTVTPTLDRTLTELFSLFPEIELTRNVLYARTLHGKWTEEIVPSRFCKDSRWQFKVNPNQTLTISLFPLPIWLSNKGAMENGFSAPLSYTIRHPSERVRDPFGGFLSVCIF